MKFATTIRDEKMNYFLRLWVLFLKTLLNVRSQTGVFFKKVLWLWVSVPDCQLCILVNIKRHTHVHHIARSCMRWLYRDVTRAGQLGTEINSCHSCRPGQLSRGHPTWSEGGRAYAYPWAWMCHCLACSPCIKSYVGRISSSTDQNKGRDWLI